MGRGDLSVDGCCAGMARMRDILRPVERGHRELPKYVQRARGMRTGERLRMRRWMGRHPRLLAEEVPNRAFLG